MTKRLYFNKAKYRQTGEIELIAIDSVHPLQTSGGLAGILLVMVILFAVVLPRLALWAHQGGFI